MIRRLIAAILCEMSKNDRKFHAVADLLPRMTPTEFEALVRDIEQHGQLEAIWIDPEGRIIDGRHRYLACRRSNIEPTFRTWNGEGSLVNFVVSQNLCRRHLTPSQLALAAARAREHYERESLERRAAGRNLPANLPEGKKGEWREHASRDFGVSARNVQNAANVIASGVAELVSAVDTGQVTVSAAAELLSLPQDLQRQAIADGPEAARSLASRMRRSRRGRSTLPVSESRNVVGSPSFRLLDGDCLTALREVPDDSVGLIVTSPPYADARKGIYGGVHPDEYVGWFLPRAEEFRRVLSSDATLILVIKEAVVDGERHPYVMELVLALRRQGWLLTEEWIWAKRNCTPGRWPNRFRDSWEHVYQFNLDRKFYMDQEAVRVPVGEWAESRLSSLGDNDWSRNASATGSPFGRNVANWVGRETVFPSNVLHLATECGYQGHPAAFPVSLPEFFVKLFSRPGDVVLDPFSGSGTTGVAALNLGREFVGVDASAEYLELSRRRFAEVMIGEDRGVSVEGVRKADGDHAKKTTTR